MGDKKQTTVIHTYDPEGHGLLPEESTSINLASILREHGDGLTVIDPTDLVLERIVRTAAGARIVFRGTDGSSSTTDFVRRLEEMGYRATDPVRVFRMGYNITDIPTVADQ